MTPLVHAKKLGAKLGLDNLYIKNDSGNIQHFHSKIRPAGVAVSKSVEFGLSSVGCASTGNKHLRAVTQPKLKNNVTYLQKPRH